LPIRLSREGYLETIPDLVVEVRSPNDTQPEVLHKVQDYLTAGARVVWVADPQAQTITIHRRDQQPQVLAAPDTLTAEDIIPGFRVLVQDMFQV
jgi:Uma2 family endonuclease